MSWSPLPMAFDDAVAVRAADAHRRWASLASAVSAPARVERAPAQSPMLLLRMAPRLPPSRRPQK